MQKQGVLVQQFLSKRKNRVVSSQAKELDVAFCLSVPSEGSIEVILKDKDKYAKPNRTVQRGSRFLNDSVKKVDKARFLEKIAKAIAVRSEVVA